jgi:hypothetical protein
LGAAEEASGWLESIPAEQGFKPAQRLELILRLDEATAAQSRRLARDYQPLVNSSRAQESRHWELSHGYWSLLLAAYLDCFTRLRAGEKDAEAMRPQQHPALRPADQRRGGGAEMATVSLRSGRRGDLATFSAGVYLAAAEARLDQRALPLYPGSGETTVEAEYLKALIFHASAMDNLKPLQIEIAERFIGYFPAFFRPRARAAAGQRVLGGWRQTAAADAPGEKAGRRRVRLRFFSGTRAVDAGEQDHRPDSR